MAVGVALRGVVESPPAGRRRAAGVFRVTAALVSTGLLAVGVVAPEPVVG